MVYQVYICLCGCLSRKRTGKQYAGTESSGFICSQRVSARHRAKGVLMLLHQAHFLLFLSQVELELESLKKQQASAADSSSLVTKEEVNILR